MCMHVCAKSLPPGKQPYTRTLWDTIDYNPPDSFIHGIFQTRILEWAAIPFSRGSSQPGDETQVGFQADSLLPEPPGKHKGPYISFNKIHAHREQMTETCLSQKPAGATAVAAKSLQSSPSLCDP